MKLSTSDAWKHVSKDKVVELSDEELAALHKIILEIADDIITYCERNGLQYSLGGGSALGAVRHHGFIPWDDDMDIDMPRRDYERFLPGFAELYGDKYWIHVPGVTERYALQGAQIRRKGTELLNHDDLREGESGVFVDIVIMENTFSNPILRMAHGIVSEFFGLAVSCRRFYELRERYIGLLGNSPEWGKSIRLKIALGKLFSWRSIRSWVAAADKWNSIYKNNESHLVTFPGGRHHYLGEIRPRAMYGTGIPVLFEGRLWRVPTQYDAYLRHHYGDNYLEVPEESKREHHAYLRIELTRGDS